MNIKPIGNKILIKKIEAEEKTKGGIVLPDNLKEKPQMAKVIAIGPKIERDDDTKGQLKVGDKVIISKYGGTEIKLEDEEYTVLEIDDILAVIE